MYRKRRKAGQGLGMRLELTIYCKKKKTEIQNERKTMHCELDTHQEDLLAV